MKNVLELFFDYTCPYCLRAHEYLDELIEDYPDISITWRPCESHPRPEERSNHTDLCIQGYFFASEHGVDPLEYHNRMYQAALKDRIDIENIDVLADYVSDLVDKEAFAKALREGTYLEALNEANSLAFERSGVWVVPAYRMDGKKLDAAAGIGVSKEQLQEFLKTSKNI